MPAPAHLLAVADWTAGFAIRAACTLGLFEALADGPRTPADAAAAINADPAAVERLLWALAAHGLVGLDDDGVARLTPMGEPLTSGHPLSLRDAYGISELEAGAWAALDHSVRTGEAAFEAVFGVSHRAYRAEHREEDVRMDLVHRVATRVDALTLLRAYDWRSARVVVDLGGGTGAFLAALLSRYPHLRGVLFDLPRMVADASPMLEDAGVADRCEIVGGDFFGRVPQGADLYVLKAVLGGWSDQDTERILQTVRAAMGPDARLLVIEPMQCGDQPFTMGNVIHLQSLVLYGGPDRTLDDYARLLAAADLEIARVIPRPTLPILEATPR